MNQENKNSFRYTFKMRPSPNCCQVSITVDKDLKTVIRDNNNHNHNPMCDKELESYIGLQSVKIDVEKNPTVSAQATHTKMHSGFIDKGLTYQDLSQYFPSFQTCGRALFKRKAKKHPQQTAELNELELLDEYKLTTNKCEFLRYDNKNIEDRMLIFVCDEALDVMSKSPQWFIDETFKSAPESIF
jgi:hypothetical protein